MIIIYGTSFVGKIDRIPGRLYLVTKVGHILYMPIVPLCSFVVQEGTERQRFLGGLESFKGHEIPTDRNSFTWGLVRAAWFLAALFASIGQLGPWLGAPDTIAASVLLGPPGGIALFSGWWWTRHGMLASPERALELQAILERAGRSAAETRGADIRTVLKITPRQALDGTTQEIPLDHPDLCDACNGEVRSEARKCDACGGTGRKDVHRTFKVIVPPGIRDGQTLRAKNQGMRSPSGPRGALYVEIVVDVHQGSAARTS